MSQKSINFADVIELERHIEILLLENDCVIVPGLGGFMTHHMEAHFDEKDCLFLPPQRTLGFNPQLKLNDSLLAQSYIEAYDISYPEAIRRIESEVSELKQHLQNEGFYELNDIGMLSVNNEGNLEFEPCDAGILTPELYGLSSIDIQPLNIQVKEDKEEKKEIEETEEKPMMVLSEDKEEPADNHTITIRLSWIRNTVAVAASLLVFFLFTTPVNNSKQTGVNMSKVNLPLIVKDTNKNNEDKLDHQTIKAALDKSDSTTVIVKKESVTAPVPEPSVSYCIVLASQVSQRNAEEFIQKLKKKGIDARIHIHNNTRRVICGNFTSEAEAYRGLPAIHNEGELSDAWVYKIKD